MGSWSISWKFSKSSYSPGELATVSFWLRNTGSTYLCLSELELIFDFGTYKLGSLCNVIPPGTNKFLGSVNLSLPKNVAGRKVFTIKYHIYEQIDKKWIDRGNYQSDKSYILNIYPKPFYKVFVSKGLRSEDRTISDPIVEMIKEWGFETKTVGDEIKVPDDQALSKIREEIRNADALIVIATPRYMDAPYRSVEDFRMDSC